MKAYTDLEQSEVIEKFLFIVSIDSIISQHVQVFFQKKENTPKVGLPNKV